MTSSDLRATPASAASWGRPPLLVRLTLVCVLLAASVAIQVARDRLVPAPPAAASSLLYIRSGELLDRVALSFDALLADVYWVRAIQHYGGTKLSKDDHKNYDLLYPLLDIVTTLDPRFNIAYRFGAIFLTEAYPNGPGRPDQAIALLEKGVRLNPHKWQYLMDIGFVHYWWLYDYKAAASWFARAAEIEGAPWYLKSLSATTLVYGGDRAASRRLWRELYDHADHEWLKSDAGRRLLQLDALDQIDQLETALQAYAGRVGRPAASWAELVRAGVLSGEPADPTGTPYALQPGGEVTVGDTSPLSPLPTEPPPAFLSPS